MSPLSISDDLRRGLLEQLDEHHGKDGQHPEDVQGESESQMVLRHVLESGRFNSEQEVQQAIDEYLTGKPLAYITGLHSFGPLSLVVRPPVYIPRVETEQWVLLLAAALLRAMPSATAEKPLRILDICSGSGCVPLLLAQQGQGRIHTVGLEVDDAALAVARENITLNGLGALCSFEKCDIFDDEALHALAQQHGTGKAGGFDLVVSNPPYVSAKDMQELAGAWWEGNYALQGKLSASASNERGHVNDEHAQDDGLSFYRRIAQIYTHFLSEGTHSERDNGSIPKLVLEIGATQSKPAQDIYRSHGRLEVYKETKRRMSVGAPKLEKGDMVGTERSLWIYEK